MRDETSAGFARLVLQIAETQDRTAFAQLFAYFGPRLKSYLMRLGSPEAEAEDLLQEVMVTLWRRAGGFDPRLASVSTWLFTIARNKRIDRLRRDKHIDWEADDPALIAEEAFGDPVPGADHAYDLAQQNDRLRAALALLPPEQASLLQQAYWEDRSHRDIAETTQIPLGTVKSRIRLALTRLRAVLKDE
ncbi:sigma-70 family RNA polymerase sigma factor [Elstera sp.]|uniref:sigma-70 family RNA polymerase sigma factor n=1 Tax=Elstera sp. TaxID=1916664 RepID=UPI0037C081D6